MKRSLVLFLLISFLLAGCTSSSEQITDSVNFYYVRTAYLEDMTSLIEPEHRDAAGHKDDLSYLLALYLIGPASEELVSPIPEDTELLSAVEWNGAITITISDTEKTMTDPQFALSCACLSMTCMELTESETVTIISGTRTITMTSSNLSLTDNAITVTEETK